MPLFESQNYTLDGLDMNHSFGDNPNPTPAPSKGGGGSNFNGQTFTPIATSLPTGLDSPLATATPTDATPLAVSAAASLPSSSVYAIAGPTAIAQKGTSTVKRSGLIILGILLGGALLFGQTTNTFYARSFAGRTVGDKVAAAQAACVSDTAVPCMIVIDATLSTAAQGTMPDACQQCHIVDYRAGQPYSPLLDNGLTIKSVTVTRDGTYTACPTATTPDSGDPAAVLAVACVFHVGPNNYTLSGISVTSGGAYTTAPVIQITGAGTGGATAFPVMGTAPTPSAVTSAGLTSGVYSVATGDHALGDGTIDFGKSQSNTLSLLSSGGVRVEANGAGMPLRLETSATGQMQMNSGSLYATFPVAQFSGDGSTGHEFSATGFGNIYLQSVVGSLRLVTPDPTLLIGNGSQICTLATGCGSSGPTLTCDASTVANYAQAVCVVTISSAQILAFDGTDATAIPVISAAGTGRAIIPKADGFAAYMGAGTDPYSANANFILEEEAGGALSGPALLVQLMSLGGSVSSLAFNGNHSTASGAGGFFAAAGNLPVGVYIDAAVTTGDNPVTLIIPFTVYPAP